MTDPGPPPNAAEIMESVNDTLQGLELEPRETSEILLFANRELPHLHTPEDSYFILGSYRDPYLRRLRIVQNELDKRIGTYPFLMADLPELDIDRLPVFRIRFTLLAAHADTIVAVYEQDAGGEVTELGKISTTPYFDKSYVLPRDYTWMTDQNLDTEADVIAAAATIYFNDDLDQATAEKELDSLLAAANKNDIRLTKSDVIDRLEEREDDEQAPVSYSWVHLNEFRLFELHNRCFAWSSQDDLRNIVDKVP
ncbi:hypothetical protein EXE43_12160 [Halorubrum sp. SS5]|uniref:Uncharacterized protein n=1 Tax=Halorubrum salinarum TaxID=2739057 RepID=A0A7D3Y326_9EURY|nr:MULTISPECIES: hypothetical protein [Halorubrum]QKG94193.1 hypothetical protein HPS36_14915 [Halorubrum salinarum]TKX52749.1 hypothetical protein EXE42_15525 [Halorubrum sp. SP3]TKX57117.1 hypothetical protein EXE44_11990 [Halorubrum sp. SS7]TKX85723.1 hypothetical protein EXE43_12160 [Halorubrum sp. SS5]